MLLDIISLLLDFLSLLLDILSLLLDIFVLLLDIFSLLLAPHTQVEPAIETYERILRVVPDHKEAVDSLLFLRGRPKGAPLRDDLPGMEGE